MTVAEDFPRTFVEFQHWFTTEQACRAYLERIRWPDGFRCPHCGASHGWQTARGLWMCGACGRQASVTAGTIFQDTRKPIRLWLLMMWSITSQKVGASAMGLQRELGFSRYETAWVWLHKLRRAMVRPRRDRLRGVVEVDETYLGGLEEGVAGRQTERKALIAIAAEEDGKGTGRIRLQHIPDASACSLHSFVLGNIEAGSPVHTDGWEGYNGLDAFGYKRKVTVFRRKTKRAHELMPRVHRVASLLKRWILGTHQGAVDNKTHLGYYLDEFTFRFNRRTSRQRGKLFFRLVQQALSLDPGGWAEVAEGSKRGPQPVGGT